MSRFVKDDHVRIDLGDGDWVILRRSLGYGSRSAIQEKLVSDLTPGQLVAYQQARAAAKSKDDLGPKLTPKLDDGTLAGMHLNLRDSNVEALRQAVVAWGGPGFCALVDHGAGESHEGECRSVEVTTENIEALDGTAERILAEFEFVQRVATPGFTKPPLQRTATEAATKQPSSDSQI